MNKNIVRSIPVAALLINALVIMIPDFHVGQIIFALLVLGGLSCFVYIRQSEPFVRKIYWYVLAAMLIGFVLPEIPFDIQRFFIAVGNLFTVHLNGGELTVLLLGLGFVVFSQLFLKKHRYTWGMVAARYAALYAAVFVLADALVYRDYFKVVLMVAVSLSAVSELLSMQFNQPKPATLRCFIFLVLYLVLAQMFRYTAPTMLTMLAGNWMFVLLCPLAGLLLAENYHYYAKGWNELDARNSVAWAMIAWVMMRLLMVIFPVLWNAAVLYFYFPLAYFLSFVCAARLSVFNWNTRFCIAGGSLCLILLSLARTQFRTLSAYVLIAVVVGGMISVGVASKKPMSAGVGKTLLGIAGVVLWGVHRFPLTGLPVAMAVSILVMVAMCVLWGIVCHQTERLIKGASNVFENEFRYVKYVGWAIPLILLLIAFIGILFTK